MSDHPARRRRPPRSAATPCRSRAGTTGLLWTALGPALLAALAGAGRAAAARRPRRGVEDGTTVAHVDRIVLCWPASWSLQTVLTRFARYVSPVFGEQVLAELREDFVGNALALPVGTVESAGTGDLLTRTSRDVEQLGWSVRWALPEWTIALVTAVLTFVAALMRRLVGALPCLLGMPPLVIGLRWYLAAPRTATCARTRRTPRSTPRSPRPSRARGPSRRSGSGDADRADRPRHRRVVRRGAVHAVPAHGVLPERGDRPTCSRPSRPCSSAAGSTPRGRSRWARSPRRRSTCRC